MATIPRNPPFNPPRAWWKSAVVYQIYPISFFDSNGDGIGDLNGIHSKLDYLKDLGVDVLWLCPIYKSPLADMGYDISDYHSIDPRYGTLEDWDRLLEGVHQRGMKLLMDLVANHTSDEHEWFKESRSSKTSSKRDWYIWRPPRYDDHGNRLPPNNWKSIFQGSAWEYDEPTGEYYLHLFVKQQPDLNWENPAVRDAVWATMRFWLDRGCDGFRMDVINMISKVDGLPDAVVSEPGEPYQPAGLLYANGPRVHQYIREMHERVLSHYDIMTVGETPLTHRPEDIAAYVLPQNRELNMVFQFEVMDIDSGGAEGGAEAVSPLTCRDWHLLELKNVVEKWQQYKREEGYWNTVYLENHDHARSVSRFGNDSPEWRGLSAKLLAMMQVTQSGTLFVYQGEEIGMNNFPRSWGIEEYKDVASLNFWNQEMEHRQKASGSADVDMSDVLDAFQRKARDHARTPLQWDSTPHAGFTAGTPWMRVNDDYATWNVAVQQKSEESVLSFWKKALKLRKDYEVLVYGDFDLVAPEHHQVFAYKRTLDGVIAFVVMNFANTNTPVDSILPSGTAGFQLVLSNYDAPDDAQDGVLRGYEGREWRSGGLLFFSFPGKVLATEAELQKWASYGSEDVSATTQASRETHPSVKRGIQKQYDILRKWTTAEGHPIAQMLSLNGHMPVPGLDVDPHKRYLSLLAAYTHPYARGTVHIVSTDPLTPPVIEPNYLSNPADLDVLVKTIRFLSKLCNTMPLAGWVRARAIPQFSAEEASDEEIHDYIKTRLLSVYHPLGTAAMLPQEDGGVVGSKLLVYGTSNLRIVDASVIPLELSANPQTLVYAIGEMAADMISGKL